MGAETNEMRQRLRESGLRVTRSRLGVLDILADADGPLSFTQVVERLEGADWDQATTYRTLVKLKEVGLAAVASRVEGIDRYVLAGGRSDGHQHPHFLCGACGRIACLPEEIVASISVDGPWAESIRRAVVQLLGECPDCLTQPG